MKNGIPKIESNIPIPPMHPKHGKGYANLLRQMKVGDSVLLPCGGQSASNSATAIFGRGKYATRKEGNGCRVWRKA